MLDHIGIYVSDIDKAKAFYAAALKPLGYSIKMEMPEWSVVGFGDPEADFWISQKEAAEHSHVAFRARDKETVNAFHAAALASGGIDNGAPGYRKDYSPGYYAAFAKDVDGNNIEVVYHDPNPAAEEAAAAPSVTIINN
ncbi:MAG: VOC family protein [Candidatus Kaiserbacteria bacterium]|nr:VOC family protein [Candidatus Kaiserbacteria bacterium]